MAVEKIFWQDPYQCQISAVVTSVDGERITVDRTIAYAFSGGQSSDAGMIGGYPIARAEKIGNEIFYSLPGHALALGQTVAIEIEWERRYRIMRLHFAAELVLELVYQRFGHPEKIGAHITDSKARVDFEWEGNISATFQTLETEIGKLVEADLPIRSDFSDRDDEIRFWEIDGFARVPCGGTISDGLER